MFVTSYLSKGMGPYNKSLRNVLLDLHLDFYKILTENQMR